MEENRKLMLVLAHPDDESLGAGGLIAKYADEGVDVYLLTATRGERGWPGDPDQNPGMDALGRLREEELHQAARALGVREGAFLDYIDGDVARADTISAVAKIAEHIRRLRPQVVVTFDPFGVYGHPDHIAVSQFTQAAVVRAASQAYDAQDGLPAHMVQKLYYLVDTDETMEQYQALHGEMVMHVNGEARRPVGWKEWAITTRLDASDYQEQVRSALHCHRSQFPDPSILDRMVAMGLFRTISLYRVYSMVNGGMEIETDLFAGLH